MRKPGGGRESCMGHHAVRAILVSVSTRDRREAGLRWSQPSGWRTGSSIAPCNREAITEGLRVLEEFGEIMTRMVKILKIAFFERGRNRTEWGRRIYQRDSREIRC